jgi:hypothetical protein
VHRNEAGLAVGWRSEVVRGHGGTIPLLRWVALWEMPAHSVLDHADAASTQAERAETDGARTRDVLEQVQVERQSARAEALVVSGRLATAISERDGAWADFARERSSAEHRVSDVRDALDQQLKQLGTDRERARDRDHPGRTSADQRVDPLTQAGFLLMAAVFCLR